MNIRPLSNRQQELARKELNEDPSKTKEAYEHIIEWLQKQLHLNINTDDQILAAFFRGCKWNLQLVKEKLDTYYTCRTVIPEFYANRDPMFHDVQNVLNSGIIFILPKPKVDLGSRICMFLLGRVDPYKTPVVVLMKVFFMIIDILMKEDDDYVVSGISVLADYNQTSPSLFLQYTPPIVKKYIKCFQNGYPSRIKSFTCINAPAVMDSIYNNLCKRFITTKLQQRAHVLNEENSKKYMNAFPLQSLPIEYGGSNGSIYDAAEEWKRKIESYRDWFLEDQKYGTNENLRAKKSKLFEEEFGVEGTFRKLVVD